MRSGACVHGDLHRIRAFAGATTPAPKPMSASNRREFLRHGTLAGLGLWCCDPAALLRRRSWLRLGALPARPGARAQSVIHFHLGGGMSHLDTFDPKPEAPGEVRGPLGTVKSKLDG